MKKYGKVISLLRKQKGLTQVELGRKLNVSFQAISKWEHDLSEPDLETIEKIAIIFDISIADFFNMANGECLNKNEEKINENSIKNKPLILIIFLGIIIVVLSLCAIFITPKYSSTQIYDMVSPSVFCITIDTDSNKQAGSGFFIDDKGTAVTNYHVIKDGIEGVIETADGKKYNIEKVIGVDEDKDIAIIKIGIDKSKPVKLGNSSKVKVGETVYAIGYPQSFALGSIDSTFTSGIVSKTSFMYEGNRYIQSTVDITNGNSGGVLVNESGKVIGITTAMLSDGNIDYMNMSIPINSIKNIKHNLNMTLKEYKDIHKVFNFYSDGRIIESQEFIIGEKIKKIEDPIKEGYRFDGWYVDKDFTTEFDFNLANKSYFNCYAKWVINTYTIEFLANGGSGAMNSVIVDYDENFTLPNNEFSYSGYTFVGWQIEGKNNILSENAQVNKLTRENEGVIRIKAMWQLGDYLIEFNGNGASEGSVNSFTIKSNETIILPNNGFERVGYKFDGWSYNGEVYKEGEELTDIVFLDDTITIFAKWEPIKYIIRYIYEDDYYDQEVTYDIETELLDNRFSKDHHYFFYWSSQIDGKNELFSNRERVLNLTDVEGMIIDFNVVFAVNQYYIRYNYNSGNQSSQGVSYFKSVEIVPIDNKQGHRFLYWEDEKGNIYKQFDRVEQLVDVHGGIIDLFPVFKEISYSVYYVADYSNRVNDDWYEWGESLTYFEEYTLKEPTYAPQGYVFSHYLINSSIYMPNDVVSKLCEIDGGSIDIEGVYTPLEVNVAFDSGGVGNIDTIKTTYNSSITLPINTLKKEGYVFVGFSDETNGRLYKEGDLFTIDGEYSISVVLTVLWHQGLQGSGSKENPYLINDFNDYRYFISQNYNQSNALSYYKLMGDIDFNEKYFNNIKYFKGVFDGNGYTFKNISFNLENIGVFSYLDGEIINFGVDKYKLDALVERDSSLTFAPLAKTISGNSKISNCYSDGSVFVSVKDLDMYSIVVGGLIGVVEESNEGVATISKSYANIMFEMDNSYELYSNADNAIIGGFVGRSNSALRIDNSYVNNDIYVKTNDAYSSSYIGGVVGQGYKEVSVSNTFIVGDIYHHDVTSSYHGTWILADVVARGNSINLDKVYVSESSKFEYKWGGEDLTLLQQAIKVPSNNFIDKLWMETNLFIDSINDWVFDGENYPKLKIFNK